MTTEEEDIVTEASLRARVSQFFRTGIFVPAGILEVAALLRRIDNAYRRGVEEGIRRQADAFPITRGHVVTRQIGAEIEIEMGKTIVRMPLSSLQEIASEIGDAADACVMDWHCVSAVALFFSVMGRYGWEFFPPASPTQC